MNSSSGQHRMRAAAGAAKGESARRSRLAGAARVRTALLLALLSTVMACLWAGCEVKVTRENYKKLSYWFDGVRDPDAPEGQGVWRGPPGTTRPARMQIVSRHKPYVEDKCAECHANKGDRPEFVVAAQSCGKCHEKVVTQYPVMHGPVVANACLWCHAPHESMFTSLLRNDSTQLCTQCHDRRVLSPETAEHQDDKKGCLDCHVGHGGTDRRLLKASWTPGPATRPALPPTSRPTSVAGGGVTIIFGNMPLTPTLSRREREH